MVQTAQLMPAGSSAELTAELICYGRSVVGTEWTQWPWPAAGLGEPVGRQDVQDGRELEPSRPPSSRRTTGGWTRRPQRQEARNDRVHTAQGIIPTPLWVALYIICAVIFGYLLFFADSARALATQACSWAASLWSSAS